MARGFLGGLVIGGAVSVLGASVLSIVAFPPSTPDPQAEGPSAEAPETPVAVGSAPAASDSPAGDALPDTSAPVIAAPEPDSGAVITEDSTTPAVRAQTDVPDAAPGTPESTDRDGAVAVAPQTPVLPAPQSTPPAAPVQEETASLETTSAEPRPVVEPEPEPQLEPEPEPVEAPAAPAEDAPDETAEAEEVTETEQDPVQTTEAETSGTAETDVAEEPAVTESVVTLLPPREPTEPETPAQTSDTETTATETPEDPAETPSEAPATETATDTADTPAEPPANTATAEEETTAEEPEPEPAQDTDVAAVTPEPQEGRPTIGTPATNLLERRSGSRLPTLSTVGVQAEVETPTETDTASTKAAPAADGSALTAYAQPFEADGRPPLSIILMDSGQDLGDGPVGLAALGSFPYPLTFAVDALLPDAEDRMAQYRSQGFEVMAMVDLPAAATATDTEVSMTAALDKVPEAVALLEGAETGFQSSREMSDQVAEIAAERGLGIVWQPKGLDTAQKLAARDGVASLTLFRDFDSAGQTPTVIRRFLDQAAFKAGQQGGVIMVGRLRPDTISALLLWGLQDRAGRVAVAPVSAVLQPGE